MTHTELIELLKQGTTLENDIDDVELLKQVLKEAAPNDESIHRIIGRCKYYDIKFEQYRRIDNKSKQSIKLSAFKTKMVSVEELRTFLDDFFESDKTKSHVTITLPEASYKQVRFGAEILKSQLLNFLNSKGI